MSRLQSGRSNSRTFGSCRAGFQSPQRNSSRTAYARRKPNEVLGLVLSAAYLIVMEGGAAKDKSGPSERGIPAAQFLDDLDGFLTGKDVQSVLKKMQEMKYKYLETQLGSNKVELRNKIPEIRSALDMVKHMRSTKDTGEKMIVHAPLADAVFVKAQVRGSDRVGIWLGANVMVEYSLADAIVLLEQNLQNALELLTSVEGDLVFLKDQITVSEVNMARVHNFDVKTRRKSKTTG